MNNKEDFLRKYELIDYEEARERLLDKLSEILPEGSSPFEPVFELLTMLVNGVKFQILSPDDIMAFVEYLGDFTEDASSISKNYARYLNILSEFASKKRGFRPPRNRRAVQQEQEESPRPSARRRRPVAPPPVPEPPSSEPVEPYHTTATFDYRQESSGDDYYYEETSVQEEPGYEEESVYEEDYQEEYQDESRFSSEDGPLEELQPPTTSLKESKEGGRKEEPNGSIFPSVKKRPANVVSAVGNNVYGKTGRAIGKGNAPAGKPAARVSRSQSTAISANDAARAAEVSRVDADGKHKKYEEGKAQLSGEDGGASKLDVTGASKKASGARRPASKAKIPPKQAFAKTSSSGKLIYCTADDCGWQGTVEQAVEEDDGTYICPFCSKVL